VQLPDNPKPNSCKNNLARSVPTFLKKGSMKIFHSRNALHDLAKIARAKETVRLLKRSLTVHCLKATVGKTHKTNQVLTDTSGIMKEFCLRSEFFYEPHE
jgi:hypothetical protein